jgi:dipeptidyl aminopeptidase/acylaminoacyl peptidase
MPWEGGQFCIQEIKINAQNKIELVSKKSSVGCANKVSALSGGWVDDETATFNNDESGFWNPWVWEAKKDTFRPVLNKPIEEDFDKPAWLIDNASWCLLSAERHTRLSYAYRDGRTVFYVVNLKSGKLSKVFSPYVDIDHLRRVDDDHFVFLGNLADAPSQIALGTLNPIGDDYVLQFDVLKSTMDEDQYPKTLISKPEPQTLIVNDGRPLYVVLYRPHNPEYEGSSIKDELPPCVVGVHGGPTAMTNQGLSWEKQYYTSRGFAWWAAFV